MFFIFGWGNRYIKDLGGTISQKCSVCSKTNILKLVRIRDWFDIFWIPIFPYNIEHHLVCPNCESAFEIEDRKTINILKEITYLFWGLEEKEITKKEFKKEYNKLLEEL